MASTDTGRTFIFQSPTMDIDEYRALAKEAARYKPYGRVLMLVGCLADKWWQGVPEGGSPWHEYASYNPTLSNLFPHPLLQPHVDMEGVKRNQEFLKAQREVVTSLGLEAWSTSSSRRTCRSRFSRQIRTCAGRASTIRGARRKRHSRCASIFPRRRRCSRG